MIHQKKPGVTVRPRSLNPGKAIAMAICPIICSIYYLERALMHDVACEFACAVGYAETISANVLNVNILLKILKNPIILDIFGMPKQISFPLFILAKLIESQLCYIQHVTRAWSMEKFADNRNVLFLIVCHAQTIRSLELRILSRMLVLLKAILQSR